MRASYQDLSHIKIGGKKCKQATTNARSAAQVSPQRTTKTANIKVVIPVVSPSKKPKRPKLRVVYK